MGTFIYESDGSYLGVFHDSTYYIKLAHEFAKRDYEEIQKEYPIEFE